MTNENSTPKVLLGGLDRLARAFQAGFTGGNAGWEETPEYHKEMFREGVRSLIADAPETSNIRNAALEEAACLAERDVDWSSFGKRDLQSWEGGVDDVRDYRLGIVAGRAIAAAIRALAAREAKP